MLDESTINQLNELSLIEVMQNNGFAVERQTPRLAFYRCPFHDEKDASFCVDKQPNPGQPYAGFKCFGCKDTKGLGAIMLQQKLLEREGAKSGFPFVTSRLAKDFNLIIEGDYKNGFFHRKKDVSPQEEISFKPKKEPLTNAELRALGCQSVPLFRREKDDKGELVEITLHDDKGAPIYKHSFGADFYRSSCSGNNFDSRVMQEQFNLIALKSYTTAARAGKDLVLRSYEVSSTDSYPIFLFKYQDEKGWWARKYEPYFRETADQDGKKAPNYKFTWWYEGDRRRDDLRNHIYGNADVMRALQTGTVSSSDEEGHPTIEVERKEDGKKRQKKVFNRIVICSGPRDAINVYFHSNAHVVFPHSENVEISTDTINKLFDIASCVYILYDIDKTGLRNMNELALKHVDLRVLYLPDDLRTMQNPRTRKACKDAEEFFNFYPAVMRKKEKMKRISVNHLFNDMLKTATRMRFWDKHVQSKKDEDGDRYMISKYTINFDSMSQFLSANGFFKYIDETGKAKFVHVQNNIVDIVEENQVLSTAKSIMKEFLIYNSKYYSEDLSNAISTQKRVGRDTMSDIREIKLNFMSWGKDFDYFFFRNCAVKVTKDSIEPKNYVDLNFHVNRDAILDYDYQPERNPLFGIINNPEYIIECKRHEQRMANKAMTEEEKYKETAHFIAYKRLYRFKLSFPQNIDEMPPCVQYLYDTSRIHWKKEALGLPLSEEEKQRQDMHFVSKVAALGYVLSRYRTGTMQQMSIFTDYSVVDEGKASGGTGKSLLYDFLSMVRYCRLILGQSFKKKENMAKNFQEFRYTVDSLFFIDDLRSDVVGTDFYNVTKNVTVKTLYNNEVTLDPDFTPKILANMNGMPFDLSEDSTARRIFLGMMSSYYHPVNYSGTVRECSPATKFGKDIVKEATREERNAAIHLMMQCCQFYLGLQESIIPPMEQDGLMRIIYSAIKDAAFIEWANKYFTSHLHFRRPIAVQELVISYLEHRGEEVNIISIRRNRDDVMKKMELYCMNLHYSMNPSITFRGDKSSKFPRHYAWVTQFEKDRPTSRPREKKHTHCCLFYQMGDEPKELKEIMTCPEVDEEKMEEARREEED